MTLFNQNSNSSLPLIDLDELFVSLIHRLQALFGTFTWRQLRPSTPCWIKEVRENWTLPRRKAVWSDIKLSTCSICLDDWPIKPVACRRCRQCIGCGDCVDRWCNERLFASPTCPLCRERWLSRREIVEMVTLPETRSDRR